MATYITPADPIQWSESTPYGELVLVTDDAGKGYVSKSAVPQGTPLTDTNYWVPIVNISDAVANASSAASAAQQAAETAQSAAETAQSAADSAQSTASTSMQGVLAAQYIALMQQGSYPIQ